MRIISSINKKDVILLKRTLMYIKQYIKEFSVAFLCVILGTVFGIIQPLIWGKMVASLLNINYQILIKYSAYMFVLYFLLLLVNYIQSYIFCYLNENIIYNVKKDMYKKVLELPIKAFDDLSAGEYISRLHGDASTVANIITNEFLNMIINVIKVLVIGIAIFSINIYLAIVVLLTFPISTYFFMKFGMKIRKENCVLSKMNDRYFNNMHQTIVGIKEIKSLGIKDKSLNNLLIITKNITKKSININKINALASSISQGVNFMMQIIIILLGGYFLLKKQLSIEHFIAFTTYSTQFSGSLAGLTKLSSDIQQALTSLERIFSLIDNLNYSKEQFGNYSTQDLKGNIKFENVSFAYTDSKMVLKEISFFIHENKKVAFVGSSGCGKTTIFNLINRFYEPTEGKILIDDIEIKKFDENNLKRNISIVHQHPFFFNTSVKNNLLLVDDSLVEEDIIKVCKEVNIHDFIMSLPQGYNTVIEEDGVNMSSGQKQILAIARALLKKSKVILFDEATSALDNQSQYYINRVINRLVDTHTIIIIAHRLFTVVDCDQIIVIDEGKVVGQGNHTTLMRENRVYKHLCETELNALTQ